MFLQPKGMPKLGALPGSFGLRDTKTSRTRKACTTCAVAEEVGSLVMSQTSTVSRSLSACVVWFSSLHCTSNCPYYFFEVHIYTHNIIYI